MVLVVVAALFGWFVIQHLEDTDAGFNRQVEATQALIALDEEVRFHPPEDGVVGEARAARFFDVTDAAWGDMREDLHDMDRREAKRWPIVRDILAVAGAASRVRLALARALQREGMAPSEYVWTGLALLHAHRHTGIAPQVSGLPAANLVLAELYVDRLEEILCGQREGQLSPATVFAAARTFIVTEQMGQRLAGLDTLLEQATSRREAVDSLEKQ